MKKNNMYNELTRKEITKLTAIPQSWIVNADYEDFFQRYKKLLNWYNGKDRQGD